MKKLKQVVGTRTTENQIVHLKKFPSEAQLSEQAIGICQVLKANRSTMTVPALLAKMKERVKSKQTMMAIWQFYRSRLIKQGFVTVERAKKSKQAPKRKEGAQ